MAMAPEHHLGGQSQGRAEGHQAAAEASSKKSSWWAKQQERMREDQKKRLAKPDPWIALKLAGG